jgi:flavin-dependent dehydrogenase
MSEVPKNADVVVIGGGPAGSLAAALLAQRGIQVVLLEKARHPRRIVGESILPHFWRYTDAIGATADMEAARFIAKAGAIVLWENTFRRIKLKDFGYDRPALHVDREIFDHILIEAAARHHASVHQEVRATEVEMRADGVAVRWKGVGARDDEGIITARFLIDASGQSALVSKQLGMREFDRDLQFASIWGYYRGGRFLDSGGEMLDFDRRYDTLPVTFLSEIGNWGWTWHIVLKDSISVGATLPREQFTELKRRVKGLENRLTEVVRTTPGLNRLIDPEALIPGSVSSIRDYAYRPTKLTVGNCYLAGDAAAFVDPINSAGVMFAFHSAYLAANCIRASLADPDQAPYYANLYERQHGARLWVLRTLALPSDRPVTDEEQKLITDAFEWLSLAERRLALTVTVLTNRPRNVTSVLQALGMSPEGTYDEVLIPQLLT